MGLACSDPSQAPIDAFNALATAAEGGDQAAFEGGFTAESQQLVAGFFSESAAHKKTMKLGPFGVPVRAIGAKIKNDMAIVSLASADSETGKARVIMRREGRSWRLDLVATEWLWNQDWAESGGKARSWYPETTEPP